MSEEARQTSSKTEMKEEWCQSHLDGVLTGIPHGRSRAYVVEVHVVSYVENITPVQRVIPACHACIRKPDACKLSLIRNFRVRNKIHRFFFVNRLLNYSRQVLTNHFSQKERLTAHKLCNSRFCAGILFVLRSQYGRFLLHGICATASHVSELESYPYHCTHCLGPTVDSIGPSIV